MLRRLAISVSAAALLCLAPATVAFAQAKYSFKMTTWFPEGSTAWDVFAKSFAEKVKTLTDGQVEIKLYAPGVLGGVFDGEKTVQDGLADMAHAWPGFIVNQDPANAFFGSLPGGMAPETLLAWVYSGGGRELWVKFREERMGLYPIVAGVLGTEVFAHSHRPLRTVDDFKGLKHRTAGAFAQILPKLGASAAVVPGPEVFTMLERKGIDSTEYLTPAENFKLGFHKVAKYVITPGVHTPAAIYSVSVKKTIWDKLPDEIKAKMELAGHAVTLESYTMTAKLDTEAMKQLRDSNVEIVQLAPETIAKIRELGREWAQQQAAEQKAKGNPWMERIAESYFAFQDTWANNASHRMYDGN